MAMATDTAVKASKAFKSKNKGDLSFKKGQIISIIGRNDEKLLLQGEFQGKKGLKSGWFPAAYVKALSEKDLDELKNSRLKEEEKRKKEEDKKREKQEQAKEKERKKQLAADQPSKKRPDKLQKYSKESKYLTTKIANRPTKESLIERGILKVENVGTLKESSTMKRKTLTGFLSSRPSKDQLGRVYEQETNSKQIFGVPLGQIMFTSYTEFKIPAMISQMISYLQENGLKEQGLFRVSGSLSETNELKDAFNRGETPDLSKYTVHSVSSTLKLFFRQLPEPLFTFDLFDPFLKSSTEMKDRESKMERFQTLLKQLPIINFVLLAKLMIFLHKVSSHAEENKMSSSNLGIVFGPTLLWQKESNPMIDMMSNTNTSDIVSFIIDEYQIFFKDHLNEETVYSVAKKPSASAIFAPATPSNNSGPVETPVSPISKQLQQQLQPPPLPMTPPPERPETPQPAPVSSVENNNHGSPEKVLKVEEPLPPEWEQSMDSKGRLFFIDHKNKRTTWEDPRLKRGGSMILPSRTSSGIIELKREDPIATDNSQQQ